MYKGPTDLIDREEYLLGKSIDKSFEVFNSGGNLDTYCGTNSEQCKLKLFWYVILMNYFPLKLYYEVILINHKIDLLFLTVYSFLASFLKLGLWYNYHLSTITSVHLLTYFYILL